MNITIVGTGYVGLVTGACLASQGFNVLCCDVDSKKIDTLRKGIIPIYEPGLPELLDNANKSGRLHFTKNIDEAVEYSEVLFVSVNTPTLDDYSCNLKQIFKVAEEIAIKMTCYKVIVHKSTVPIGTGHKVKALVSSALKSMGKELEFDIVSNPEFLREGSAINDFLNPDRIVIGAEGERPFTIMKDLYSFQSDKGIPLIETNIETAEMIKYASNTFLATKISFINEIANICELSGADAIITAKSMGLDERIGMKFLEPGPGFGGSCFPKDVKALLGTASALGYDAKLIKSVLETNECQKLQMVNKIKTVLVSLENKVISILGLSFKPETDDIRESPSISIIEALLSNNAIIKVYDPKAMENTKKQYTHYSIEYCENPYEACKESDCIVLMTNWKEFSGLDFKMLADIVHKPVFFDLRNVYDPVLVKSFGFYYEGVGRKN